MPTCKLCNITFPNRETDEIKRELDKCVLVCSNCHAEIHAGLIKLADVV